MSDVWQVGGKPQGETPAYAVTHTFKEACFTDCGVRVAGYGLRCAWGDKAERSGKFVGTLTRFCDLHKGFWGRNESVTG